MAKRAQRVSIHNQHGAALITALVILVALTVIGVSAFKTSNLEELIVGNLRDKELSFQAAETALSDAEKDIDALVDIPIANSTGSNGVFTRDRFGDYGALAYTMSVWNSHATEYGSSGSVELAEVTADPVFIIEHEAFHPDDLNPQTRAAGQGRFYYRITSRGEGQSANAVTLLQETYGKRYR